MGPLRKFMSKWVGQFSQQKGKKAKMTPLQTLIVILALGIGIMIISQMFSSGSKSNEAAPAMFSQEQSDDLAAFKSNSNNGPQSMKDYEIYYENNLKDMLDKVTGISNASVMVILGTTEKIIYEQNEKRQDSQTDESDSNNGSRKITESSHDSEVVITNSGSKESPVVVGKEKPKVTGVIIVADGLENAKLRAMIVEAVSSVFDVPAHRVSALPSPSKGE